MSRGWAKASACLLQVSLSCAVPCQIVSLQYLSRSLFTACPGRLCSLSSFLVIWSPSGDTGGPSVVLRRLMCPAQDHFIFLILLIISDVCPLPDPDVILLSILVCAAASLFCACLVSVKCSRRYRSWKRH